MEMKDMLKPIAYTALLSTVGAIYANHCYRPTSKTCAVTNDLVREEFDSNAICYNYWYATANWLSPDVLSNQADGYAGTQFNWCTGMAKKFNCATGTFDSPSMTTANRLPFEYEDVNSVPCSL
jgi:hypothetical protein